LESGGSGWGGAACGDSGTATDWGPDEGGDVEEGDRSPEGLSALSALAALLVSSCLRPVPLLAAAMTGPGPLFSCCCCCCCCWGFKMRGAAGGADPKPLPLGTGPLDPWELRALPLLPLWLLELLLLWERLAAAMHGPPKSLRRLGVQAPRGGVNGVPRGTVRHGRPASRPGRGGCCRSMLQEVLPSLCKGVNGRDRVGETGLKAMQMVGLAAALLGMDQWRMHQGMHACICLQCTCVGVLITDEHCNG
jgi:hypothetical protein